MCWSAQSEIPCFTGLPGNRDADDVRPARFETGRFQINGDPRLFLQASEELLETFRRIHQVIRRLPVGGGALNPFDRFSVLSQTAKQITLHSRSRRNRLTALDRGHWTRSCRFARLVGKAMKPPLAAQRGQLG